MSGGACRSLLSFIFFFHSFFHFFLSFLSLIIIIFFVFFFVFSSAVHTCDSGGARLGSPENGWVGCLEECRGKSGCWRGGWENVAPDSFPGKPHSQHFLQHPKFPQHFSQHPPQQFSGIPISSILQQARVGVYIYLLHACGQVIRDMISNTKVNSSFPSPHQAYNVEDLWGRRVHLWNRFVSWVNSVLWQLVSNDFYYPEDDRSSLKDSFNSKLMNCWRSPH